ncbi:mechanosensitive ion channel family protein [Thermogymnomonas acidicola]|uniref:mechanosensitive ion channel family protein n=1 Tax=Thermogymnomonas acidicola TaxID=399579 RepID=UPI00094661D7|nr:mechanosensitive ion channel family protein [Thermogymnomonas acidicola]
MPSLAREVSKIIVYAVIAVALVYVIDFVLAELSAEIPVIHTYHVYIRDATVIAIALIVAYLVSSVINKGISSYTSKRNVRRSLRGGIHIFIRTIIFVIALIWALSAIGVNISAAILGGSIGGIVVGFALQTVLENLLSGGVMASSSGVIVPGQYMILYSWLFEGPIVGGQVLEVRTLWSTLKTIYGNIISVPNSALIGSATFTDINVGGEFIYQLQVTVNGDVNSETVLEKVNQELSARKINSLSSLQIYFSSKNGGNNTFTVELHMTDFSSLPGVISEINRVFERAYWEVKAPPKQ